MKHEISPLLREFLEHWRAYVAQCEIDPDSEEKHPYMNRIMGLCDNSAAFMRFKAEGTERHPLSHDQAYVLYEELQEYFRVEYDLSIMKGPLTTPIFPFDHEEFIYMFEEQTWKNPKRNAWVAEQLSSLTASPTAGASSVRVL